MREQSKLYYILLRKNIYSMYMYLFLGLLRYEGSFTTSLVISETLRDNLICSFTVCWNVVEICVIYVRHNKNLKYQVESCTKYQLSNEIHILIENILHFDWLRSGKRAHKTTRFSHHIMKSWCVYSPIDFYASRKCTRKKPHDVLMRV